jgi:hypothetical protein
MDGVNESAEIRLLNGRMHRWVHTRTYAREGTTINHSKDNAPAQPSMMSVEGTERIYYFYLYSNMQPLWTTSCHFFVKRREETLAGPMTLTTTSSVSHLSKCLAKKTFSSS